MKTAIFKWLTLSVLLAVVGPARGAVIVDSACIELQADGSFLEIIPQVYLDRARQLKVLFCHASVGGTIMNGMVGRNGLASQNPARYYINRQENEDPVWFDRSSGIIDVSRTDWPLNGSKSLGFDNLIRNLGYGEPSRLDVAFMKFCYIDWLPGTNVQKKWEEYRATMEALEADYPEVTFVWWTTAISTAGAGGDVRETFNNLVREYCVRNGKVLFDLADIESHDRQGNPCCDDIGAEALYAGYAVDGAHPTGIGQTRLASAMWWLLARVAGWETGPTRIHLAVDSTLLGADTGATTEVTARLYDENNGLFIEAPEREITFHLNGPGRLMAPTTLMTTDGRAMIRYEAATSPGTAVITATSAGLIDGSVSIRLFANNPPEPPTDLLCDGLTNPAALPHGSSELTWTFSDCDAALGDRQSAYRVIIADNATDIHNTIGNVWDTARVPSRETSARPCVVPLRPGLTYYWKVQTWDVSNEEGAYSHYATFDLADGAGYAVRLDPGTGSVDFGNDTSLDLYTSNGLTIEMWLYRTEENVESVILDKFDWGAGGYRVGIDASNHIYFRTREQRKGDRRVVALDAEVRKGRWHHVACCQLGQTGTDDGVIYIDGIECGRNGLIYSPWPIDANLRLQPSGALVDELRLSDTIRYAGNFTPPTEDFVPDGNTLGLWHFDEGEGTVANDSSGHNNTGTINADFGWAAGHRAHSHSAPIRKH